MAEVDTIVVLDGNGVSREVPTLLSLETLLAGVAHDAAASAVNPVLTGGYLDKTAGGPDAASTAIDAVRDRVDASGASITRPHTNLESIVTGNASNTDGTSTSCIAASGDAAIKHYLTTIILTNTSGSNIYVEIKDGATAKLTIPLPANSGAVVNLPVPLPGTANTAWNFDPSAATTTVYCSMIGFKSKV